MYISVSLRIVVLPSCLPAQPADLSSSAPLVLARKCSLFAFFFKSPQVLLLALVNTLAEHLSRVCVGVANNHVSKSTAQLAEYRN